MTKTITVEGDLSTVDTRVNLTSQGSVPTPSLVIPAGISKIDKIIAAVAPDLTAVGAGGFFIALGGAGVLGGEQAIAIGDAGGAGATADSAGLQNIVVILEDADIDVRAQDTVKIGAEMVGADLGDAHIAVTLIFA